MKNQELRKQYLLDENNQKVAVMLDIKTFDRIEEALENYGLMKYILENKKEKPLKVEEAKAFYKKLKKAK